MKDKTENLTIEQINTRIEQRKAKIEKNQDKIKTLELWKNQLEKKKSNDDKVFKMVDPNNKLDHYYFRDVNGCTDWLIDKNGSIHKDTRNTYNQFETQEEAEKIAEVVNKYNMMKLVFLNARLKIIYDDMESDGKWETDKFNNYLIYDSDLNGIINEGISSDLQVAVPMTFLDLGSDTVFNEVKRRMGAYWQELEKTLKRLV